MESIYGFASGGCFFGYPANITVVDSTFNNIFSDRRSEDSVSGCFALDGFDSDVDTKSFGTSNDDSDLILDVVVIAKTLTLYVQIEKFIAVFRNVSFTNIQVTLRGGCVSTYGDLCNKIT